MQPIRLYKVFSDDSLNFHGNASTVVLLDGPLPDAKMQQLAADLAQPATTFLHPLQEKNSFSVRWFAPDEEIDVCGHGAAAAIAYLSRQYQSKVTFKIHYRSGYITGSQPKDNFLEMELPAFRVTEEINVTDHLKDGLGIDIVAHFKTENKNIVLVENEETVKNLKPNFNKLRQDGSFGYIVTAPGTKTDFVSRTFVPHVGQLEDPATGSSHATLTPFWADRLGKNELTGHQLSKRGGAFSCVLKDDQVILSGSFSLVMEGQLVE